MLAVGPATGQFLWFLAVCTQRTRILDLGTGVGYSALWLADAARRTGGYVISVDHDESKLATAITHAANADCLDRVRFEHADALAFLGRDAGPWDLVLLDLWKEAYVPCFEALLPVLAPDALVVADNMRYPAETRPMATRYQEIARTAPGMLSFEVDIGNGLELSWVDR